MTKNEKSDMRSNNCVFNYSPADLKTSPYGQDTNGNFAPLSIDKYGNVQTGMYSLQPSLGSMFDRLQTAEYTEIFNVLSTYGISNLRDVVTTAGSGSVTNTGNGYVLTTTTAANDIATLDTAERGRFNNGSSFEMGIVVQIPTPPSTSTQRAIWGMADNSNGMYFGQDSTGIFAAVLRGGSETKVYKSSWNIDKLDGTGPSGLTLNTNIGTLYQIRYGYSYGIIEYRVVFIDAKTYQQTIVVCHRQFSTTGTLIIDPNQPIRAQIQNGATAPASAFTMNMRGRYYSNLGVTNPLSRITSERRINVSSNNSTFTPTVSFQRQATFPSGSGRNNSINVTINSFDIISSADIVWQLRLNSTLTGATFAAPSETPSSETCVLSDISATAITMTTGIKVMGGLAASGVRAVLNSFPVNVVMPGTQSISLCVLNLSQPTGTVNVVLRVTEEW